MRRAIVASTLLKLVFAADPVARWGHQAVYLPSQNAMWVVGGEVQGSGTQITNEVLILPLNQSNPTFSTGSSDGLPPHAFAAMSARSDGSSIVVFGGMTSSCSNDGLVHTLDVSSGKWTSVTPSGVIRRRGASMGWASDSQVMVVGGIADSYSCSSTTAAYSALDILSYPLTTGSHIASANLPSSLTGSTLAVSDFAMALCSCGHIYLAGGQSATGDLVSLDTIGKWSASSGWTSQVTSGDVPDGRIGASLVVHPTLDLLILYGGSVANGTSDTPTSLVALLNTTSWEWSTPSNLQPLSSSASSYHTAIITNSGVMITAFGLGSSGVATSNVAYLDMRDPTGSDWAWSSTWQESMLNLTTSPKTSKGQTMDEKKTASIAAPVAVIGALLIGLAIWYARRQIRIIRKRRAARYYSFSLQEDNGDFSRDVGPSRPTKTEYGFGRDANEKEGNLMTDITSGVMSVIKRVSTRGSNHSTDSNPFTDREMVKAGGSAKNKAINWEEIDFGLGKLDESRREEPHAREKRRSSSFSATGSPPQFLYDQDQQSAAVASTMSMPMPMPLITLNEEQGSPVNDGQQSLVPSFFVQPPTAPATPSNRPSAPAVFPDMPTMPTAAPDTDESLDWNMLQNQLAERPAFRSISPSAALRSHNHAQVDHNPGQFDQPRPAPMPQYHAPTLQPEPMGQYPQRSASPSQVPLPVSPSPSTISTMSSTAPHLPPLNFNSSNPPTINYGPRNHGVLPYLPRNSNQSHSRQLAGVPRRGVSHHGIDSSSNHELSSSIPVSHDARQGSGLPMAPHAAQMGRGNMLRVMNRSERDAPESDTEENHGQAF
ncbi:hypothetical protein TREMEDRAFT_37960 [Tremella mesenterica DSM 1558]|uniref:uncharacterized protein n=1 Tax=Tremella mesenterica (strain ATCC 24925 / CBS 8224 / DSM 1558 / NBRC 9311 / NRRL Y-6157 / RJB 2259-6 / UBC 559-6) TaxID=578456 RepID=UPI0003F4A1F3|nr:uncharacterized protein TREMEDRAFT_37960 [Tremella mesenterica DSM 1558]EIW71599.1 hypothetical protein TREMEDRAFT_37960 [Tremella mesenterica DSM 1558]